MTSTPCRGTIGILIATLLAGCTGHPAMLPSDTTASSSAVTAASLGMSPDACSDPAKLKVCLKPGGTYKLQLTLTCKIGTQSASCGTTTWSTKTSNKLLGGKFKPNPGDPTTETVTAAKTIKIGHYSQTISVSCTGVPNCNYKSNGAIWIVK